MTNAQLIACAIEGTGALVLFVLTFFIYKNRRTLPKTSRQIVQLFMCVGLMLGADALAYVFRGTSSEFGYFAVRAANYLAFMLSFLIVPILTRYTFVSAGESLRKYNRFFVFFTDFIVCVDMVILITNIFTGKLFYFDEMNYYHRGELFMVSQLLMVVAGVILIMIMLVNWKHLLKFDKQIVIIYLVLPASALIMQTFIYGYSFFNIGTFIAMLLTYGVCQARWSEYLKKQEEEVNKQKLRLIYEMMQPHFMFNALGSIEALLDIDVEEARKALFNFSSYLRSNLDASQGPDLISFEEELKHVSHYVALEETRFGDRIFVDYDLEIRDFLIPYQTVEVLVESAIRRGISKKEEGGAVLISTKDLGDKVMVIIEDDGVGIDCNLNYDEENHLLYRNIEERIEKLVNGVMKASSQENVGTKIVIEMEKRI